MGRPFNLFLSEYLTTAMGMPFEVGKTLLQVEYRPKRRFEPLEEADQGVKIELEKFKEKFKEEDELSNPEEAEMYFTDRLAQSSEPVVPATEQVLETDAAGYLADCELLLCVYRRSRGFQTHAYPSGLLIRTNACWRSCLRSFLTVVWNKHERFH